MKQASRSRRSSTTSKGVPLLEDESLAAGLGVQALKPPTSSASQLHNLRVSCIGTFHEHVRCGCAVKGLLFTGDNKGLVLQWNSLDASSQRFADFTSAVNVLEVVTNRHEIWVGIASGDIAAVDVETKTVRSMWHAHLGGVNCFAVATECVWSGGADFNIKKWDLSGRPLGQYGHHHTLVRHLLLVSGANSPPMMQLWSCSNESSIAITSHADDVANNEISDTHMLLNGRDTAVFYMCRVGEDMVWSGSEDGAIRVWGIAELSCRKELRAHKGPVCSIISMGAHVWSASQDHMVNVWDSCQYQLLFTLGDQGGYVRAMVKVEWMLWVFAAEKNVKIWVAQSLWASYRADLEKITATSLEHLQRAQHSETEVLRLKDLALREASSKDALEKQLRIEIQSQRDMLQNANEAFHKKEHAALEALKDLKDCSLKRRVPAVPKLEPQEENSSIMAEITQLRTIWSDIIGNNASSKSLLEENVVHLRQELEEAQNKRQEAQNLLDLAKFDTEKAMLNAEKVDTEQQQINDDFASKLAEMQRALVETRTENLQVNARLQLQENDNISYIVERDRLLQENLELGKKLNELNSALLVARNNFELTSREKGTALESLQRRQFELQAVNDEVLERSKQLQKYEASTKQMHEELENLKNLQATTAKEKEKAEKELADLKARMEDAEGNVRFLQGRLSEAAASIQVGLKEREQLEAYSADMKQHLEQALKRLESLQEEKHKCEVQIIGLSEELVNAQKENISLEANVKILDEQLDKSSISAYEGKLATSRLHDEVAKMNEKAAQSSDRAVKDAAIIQALQEEVTRLMQDLASQRMANDQLLAIEGGARQKQLRERAEFDEAIFTLRENCAATRAANLQTADANEKLILELKHTKRLMVAQKENLLNELHSVKEGISRLLAEVKKSDSQLHAASEVRAMLQQRVCALEAKVVEASGNTSELAEAKAAATHATGDMKKQEVALGQAYEVYGRVCAERSNSQAEKDTSALAISSLGVDIPQNVGNLYLAESCLQESLSNLEPANKEIKRAEQAKEINPGGLLLVKNGHRLEYTRCKIIPETTEDFENIQKSIPPHTRSGTPLQIMDECAQTNAEPSQRAYKEKERYLSGRGLLRGPFP